MSGVRVCVMVENPLAFNFSKTRTICDAFDDAWAFLQGLGSDLTEPSKSLITQTILAKRIIEMADRGLRDIPELRDDALAFLQHSPPSAWRNGLRRTIGAQTASLAELETKRLQLEYECAASPGPFPRGGRNALRSRQHIAHLLCIPRTTARRALHRRVASLVRCICSRQLLARSGG